MVVSKPSEAKKNNNYKLSIFVLLAGSALSFPNVLMADEVIDGGQVISVPGSHASPWTVDGYLTVGNTGAGTLNIGAGGVVNGSTVVLGAGNGSSGNLTITGSGAKLNVTGQLLVGNAGTGTLTIADGGVVSAGTSNLVIGGSTTGSGAITVNGTAGSRGVLEVASIVRSGASGTLTLNGGILRALSDSSNFLSGVSTTINVDGGYIDTNGHNVTVTSAVAGSGKFVKQGAGTLLLATAATYTGGTLIDGGTLQLGNNTNSTVGTVVGDIENNGQLVYYNSANQEISSVISGSGSVEQKAASVLTLLGENTYTGGTIISAGTLQVGKGGTVGSIKGNVVNSGKLIFNRSDDITFAGDMNGSGSLQKLAAGTLILTGKSTHTGGTIISAGTLQVGSGGTEGSITGNITNNSKMVFNRSDSYVFDGVVSGAGTVQQNGAGTLIIAGANTYTGVTTISSGALQIGNGAAIGSITGNITNNSKLVFNRSDAYTYGGVVSGSGSVEQKGTGTTTLSGTNTFSGGTTISNGTLKVTNAGALSTGNVKNNSNLELAISGNATFANILSGTGTLIKSGSGVTTLTGKGSQVGAVDVTAGTLVFGQNGSFTANNLTTESGATTSVAANSSLNVTADMTQATGGALTVTATSTVTVGGKFKQETGSTLNAGLSVSGGARIVADSAEIDGTLNVSGIATSGITKASDLSSTFATLLKTTNGITGDFSSIAFNTGTDYLIASGRKSSDGKNYDVGLALAWFAGSAKGHGTFTVANAADSFTVDVALTDQTGTFVSGWDGKSLTKSGNGTLVLSGKNTYTGGTTVNGGTLKMANANALVQNSTWVINGGTLDVSNNNLTMTSLSGTGGVIAMGTGNLTINQAGNTSAGASIRGTGSITKTGAGTLTLSGANTYTGTTTISQGTLALSGGGSISSSSMIQVDSTLDISGISSATSVVAINGAGTINLGGRTLSISNASTTFAGVISGNGGNLTIAGGTQTLTGKNTYTGTTTVNKGTKLVLTGDGALSSSTTLVVNGTFDYTGINGTGVTARDLSGSGSILLADKSLNLTNVTGTYDGTLTGSGAFNVSSTTAGFLTLTNNNSSFTGLTTVNNTTFTLNGGSVLGGDLLLNANSYLRGSGTVNGNATINGTIRVNNNTGTITFKKDLVFGSTASSNFDLANNRGDAAITPVSVGGNLTLGGTLNVSVGASGFYRLFNYDGTLSGHYDTVKVAPPEGGTFNPTGYDVVTSVPNQVNFAVVGDGQTMQFWDGTDFAGSDPAVGNAGTWNSSATNWSQYPGVTGKNAAWASSIGVFTGNAGTVTVSGTQAFDTLQFSTTGYTLNDGALALSPSGSGVTSAVLNIDNGVNAVINSKIVDGTSTALRFVGLGTLTLGGDSTYTGGITVETSKLTLTNATAAGTGTITTNDGTELHLNFATDSHFENKITGTGTIYSESSAVTEFRSGAATSSVAAMWMSNGTNVFGAGSNFTAASLNMEKNATLSVLQGGKYTSSGWLRVASGTINVDGTNSVLTYGRTNTLESLGEGGNVNLNITNGGTLNFAGSQLGVNGNSSSAVANIIVKNSGSSLNLENKLTLGWAQGTVSNLTIQDNAVVKVAGNFSIRGGAGVVTIASGGQLLTGSATLTEQSNLAGKATITVNGTSGSRGVWQTANIIRGNTASTLNINGGIIRATQDDTNFISGFADGEITLGSGNGYIDAQSYTVRIADVVGGGGGLVKQGTGTLILSNTNTYTGGTTVETGTLQIGNSYNNGSVVGNIANSGIVAFNRANTYIYDGIISGTGSLQQDGAGVTILSNDHTYTGTTTINAGTLQIGNGGTKGSFIGNVVNNGTLAFDRTDSGGYVYGAVISGTGNVQQAGSGTTILTADNTYTGNTIISKGTLQVGNGGTTGKINGNVSNSGILAFNRSDNITYAGVISGKGSVAQNGSAAVTLSSANTYSGGTNVNKGTIIASNTGALGTGDIYNNGTLELAFSKDSSLANTFTGGTGTLKKTETGITTITGQNNKLANVIVAEGGLSFDQTEDNITAQAANYTTKSGASTSLSGLASLTLSGNLVQETGSSLSINANQASVPFVNAAGTATLDGTFNLTGFNLGDVDRSSGLSDNTLTLIASSGMTGEFSKIITDGAQSDYNFLSFNPHQVDNNYVLGVSLRWNASVNALGTFTLAKGTKFTVDTSLSNQTANGSWDGKSLTKDGEGTLVLAANNSFSGPTTIKQGRLEIGEGGALGTLNGDVNNSGVLAFNRTTDSNGYVFSGQIGGIGSLEQNGTGTTILTADSDIIGGTTINAGVLQLGNGGTSGSITHDIVNKATLAFNRSDALKLDQIISGTGNVIQRGAGTTTLDGKNTYSGGTSITTGRLVAGNGSAVGTGKVDVGANTTFELNFSADGTLANQLSGTGALIKTGTDSQATLTASNSSVGAITVSEGKLKFAQNGAFNGASLATSASTTTIFNYGSNVALTGAYTQAAASSLEVTVGDVNQAFITSKTAALAGTLTINNFSGTSVVAKASDLNDAVKTIISTTNGISGDFSSVTINGTQSTVDYLTVYGRKTDDNKSYVAGFGLSWLASESKAHGTFTLTNATDAFNLDVAMADRTGTFPTNSWNGKDLTKAGAGTLTLSAVNTYTGKTNINAGTLKGGIANAFATSSEVIVATGATLDLAGYNQIANNLNGAGSVALGNGVLTANISATETFSGIVSGTGSVTKTGASDWTLSGINTYSGGSTISAGKIIATNGSALGTGKVTNNSALELAFATNSTMANVFAGTGTLTKTGVGTATLTGKSSVAGDVSVAEGTLSFAQDGKFYAKTLQTAASTTTVVSGVSQVELTGAYTQAATTSALDVTLGETNQPIIKAKSAELKGSLTVSGFSGTIASKASDLATAAKTIVATSDGITGDFSSVDISGAQSTLDYIQIYGRKTDDNKSYVAGFGLSWLASESKAHGTFTLTNASDAFNLDVAMADRTGTFPTNSWNGKDLTKAGAGTLTLSAVNSYTGKTNINAGTLKGGIANAFATSSEVVVATGATLDLAGYNQIANNLTGAGSVALGNGVLTANISATETFSGIVSGTGSVTKTGASDWTLSGVNTYSGGSTISAGKIIATNGSALGTGKVTNNSALELAFATNSTMANVFAGTGTLTKTGVGTATLTGKSSVAGDVSVTEGTLSFGGTSLFNGKSLTTENTTTAALDGTSQLVLSGNYTQKAGSHLNVIIGSDNDPIVSADKATLSGDLNVTGFSGTLSTKASTLNGSEKTIIKTVNGITGEFDPATINQSSTVDYVIVNGYKTADNKNYVAGFTLAWLANEQTNPNAQANGSFTLTNASDVFNVDIALADRKAADISGSWDGRSLTKNGAGILTLSATNTYTGKTSVNAGTLKTGIKNSFATSSEVVVASGASLDLNGFDQLAKNLNGAGGVTLGSGELTADISSAKTFSGVISGTGSITKTGTSDWTLSGQSTYSGGTTLSAGKVIANIGSALGTGTVTNNSALELSFASNSTFANVLAGSGTLNKTGSGIATLTGKGSTAGVVTVSAGTLSFAQAGEFNASSLTTNKGTTTTIGGDSQLVLGESFTHQSGATLEVVIGSNTDDGAAVITAESADLNGGLNVKGFSGSVASKASLLAGSSKTIIKTTNGITGDFNPANINGSSGVDYVIISGKKANSDKDYVASFELAWNADSTKAIAHGTFTVADATSFDVDVAMVDRTGTSFAKGWDGKSLTKEGAGTLTLSAANTYTGSTTVNGGTLKAGIANAFATSIEVSVAKNGTLDLNGFNQLANNLNGSGSVILGNAILTADISSAKTFSGVISGTGSVIKNGTGDWTLSGESTYTGGTNINAGKIIATNGKSLGTGTVNNDTELSLSFATNSTFANTLEGTGTLTKTGVGVATLTGKNSSAGDVKVMQGTLNFAQAGKFLGTTLTTESGATAKIDGESQLVLSDAYTQKSGSHLEVVIGSDNNPVIKADSADLSGDLVVTGFSGEVASKASLLSGSYKTIIETSKGITGDFNPATVNGSTGVDYVIVSGQKVNDNKDYVAGFQLAWTSDPNKGTAHGSFTLADATAFEVDVSLSDVSGSSLANGWNGKSLTKDGEGTLILSADNSYSGGTTVKNGTLQIGNGGTTGSVLGDINNDGNVAFNRSDNIDFTNVISGTGSLEQKGTGILKLSNNNTFSGGTIISSGTLQIGDGGTSGAITGAIKNDGTLVYNRSDDIVLSDVVSGIGSFVKRGQGSLTVNSINSFTGLTTLETGTLIIGDRDHASALIAGSLNALSGTRLAGYGTIGSGAGSVTTISSGATLAPGNSIGTLNINGDLIIEKGATYEVETNPSGLDSDLVHVIGTATINGGSVYHIGIDGEYRADASYRIVTADKGVTGTFDDLVSNYAYLNPYLDYDANNVYLVMARNDVTLCGKNSLGGTHNQTETACGVEGTGDLEDKILTLDKDSALDAFNQLSGEAYASVQGAMVEDSRFPRDAIFMRMRSAFDGVGADKSAVIAIDQKGARLADATTDRLALWGHAFGSWSDLDGNGNAAKAKRSIGGMFVGLDTPLSDHVRAGVIAGYAKSTFKVDDRHSSMDIDSYYLGAYVGGQWDAWRLTGGLNYTWNKLDSERSVYFSNFVDKLDADYKADLFQVFGETSYQFRYLETDFEPYAQLAYVKLDTDSFTENGGIAALKTGSETMDTFYSSLGLRVARDLDIHGIASKVSFGAGWRHAYGDITPETNKVFATNGVSDFNVTGIPIAQDMAVLEAGVDFKINPKTTLGLTYQGMVASKVQDHGFKLNLNVQW